MSLSCLDLLPPAFLSEPLEQQQKDSITPDFKLSQRHFDLLKEITQLNSNVKNPQQTSAESENVPFKLLGIDATSQQTPDRHFRSFIAESDTLPSCNYTEFKSENTPEEKVTIPGLDIVETTVNNNFWQRYDTSYSGDRRSDAYEQYSSGSLGKSGVSEIGQWETIPSSSVSEQLNAKHMDSNLGAQDKIRGRSPSSRVIKEQQTDKTIDRNRNLEYCLRKLEVDLESEKQKISDRDFTSEQLTQKIADVAKVLAGFFNDIAADQKIIDFGKVAFKDWPTENFSSKKTSFVKKSNELQQFSEEALDYSLGSSLQTKPTTDPIPSTTGSTSNKEVIAITAQRHPSESQSTNVVERSTQQLPTLHANILSGWNNSTNALVESQLSGDGYPSSFPGQSVDYPGTTAASIPLNQDQYFGGASSYYSDAVNAYNVQRPFSERGHFPQGQSYNYSPQFMRQENSTVNPECRYGDNSSYQGPYPEPLFHEHGIIGGTVSCDTKLDNVFYTRECPLAPYDLGAFRRHGIVSLAFLEAVICMYSRGRRLWYPRIIVGETMEVPPLPEVGGAAAHFLLIVKGNAAVVRWGRMRVRAYISCPEMMEPVERWCQEAAQGELRRQGETGGVRVSVAPLPDLNTASPIRHQLLEAIRVLLLGSVVKADSLQWQLEAKRSVLVDEIGNCFGIQHEV